MSLQHPFHERIPFYSRGLQKALWWALAGGMFALVFLTVMISGPEVERRLFPVQTEWTVTSVRNHGRDLIVEGTFVKSRNCAYVPPPIARTDSGQNLIVESMSPTATISWPASDTPQKFGPWRVRDGAGKHLVFYQRHQCHSLWATFTRLGEVNSSAP